MNCTMVNGVFMLRTFHPKNNIVLDVKMCIYHAPRNRRRNLIIKYRIPSSDVFVSNLDVKLFSTTYGEN